jgi:hypothetical protein
MTADSLKEVILADIHEDVIQMVPNDSIEYPNPTPWRITTDCCRGTPCVRIDGDDRLFWGSWQVNLFTPIFSSCLILLTLGIFYGLIFPKFQSRTHQIIASIELGILLFMFLWSYYAASCMDPGFLPFDWVRTQRFRYDWQDQLSGLAIRSDQIAFAEEHRPAFASFSRAYGRFVIRGDHICGWIGNWVGKRNHKQFLLMGFWGAFYAISLMFWNLLGSSVVSESSGWQFLLIFGGFGTDLVFAIGLSFVFLSSMNDLRHNLTTIQRWKRERGENYGCVQSMREVCGTGWMICWICPLPAFDTDLFIAGDDYPPNECV